MSADNAGQPICVSFGDVSERACPLCSCRQYKVIGREHPHGQLWYSNDIFNVVLCSECHFVYVTPIPSRSWNLNYHNPRINPDLCVGEHCSVDTFEHSKETFSYLYLKGLNEIVKRFKTLKHLSLLDVGCSEGYFVKTAVDRGINAIGCDIQPAAVERGREEFGLDLYPGEIHDLNIQPGSMDVITLWNVMEHVDDPITLLGNARALLKAEGFLICLTPNFTLLKVRSLLRGNQKHTRPQILPYWGGSLHPWDHINFWTPRDLDRALKMAGLINIFTLPSRRGSYPFYSIWKLYIKKLLSMISSGNLDIIWPYIFVTASRGQ